MVLSHCRRHKWPPTPSSIRVDVRQGSRLRTQDPLLHRCRSGFPRLPSSCGEGFLNAQPHSDASKGERHGWKVQAAIPLYAFRLQRCASGSYAVVESRDAETGVRQLPPRLSAAKEVQTVDECLYTGRAMIIPIVNDGDRNLGKWATSPLHFNDSASLPRTQVPMVSLAIELNMGWARVSMAAEAG